MLKFFLSVFLYSVCIVSFSQNDSIVNHATIRISKPRDTAYIRAFTNFYVYYDSPTSDLSYKDYVLQNRQRQMRAGSSGRVKIADAKPKNNSETNFDYTSYFQNNHFTKDIKMRPEEADTIRFLVYVSPKGLVKYIDLTPLEKKEDATLIYNYNKKEFKEDVSHLKTQHAFDELIKEKWEPAIIYTLKKHPSKRKKKYYVSKAHSEGILTVIYSSMLL